MFEAILEGTKFQKSKMVRYGSKRGQGRGRGMLGGGRRQRNVGGCLEGGLGYGRGGGRGKGRGRMG